MQMRLEPQVYFFSFFFFSNFLQTKTTRNGNHNYNGGASVGNLKYVDSEIDHHGCDD